MAAFERRVLESHAWSVGSHRFQKIRQLTEKSDGGFVSPLAVGTNAVVVREVIGLDILHLSTVGAQA